MKRGFIRIGEARKTGVEDIEGFVTNFGNIGNYLWKAYKNGYYIEFISLQLQLIDFWLRILVTNNNKRKKYGLGDKITFGKLLIDVKEYLPLSLYQELVEYNNERINAIHKFVLGKCSYNKIGGAAKKYKMIHKKVFTKLPLAKTNEHVLFKEIDQE